MRSCVHVRKESKEAKLSVKIVGAMRDSENIAPVLSEAAPALAVSNARRWTIVWLLFAASLINYFDRQTLSYALPLLAGLLIIPAVILILPLRSATFLSVPRLHCLSFFCYLGGGARLRRAFPCIRGNTVSDPQGQLLACEQFCCGRHQAFSLPISRYPV
jgi:hypothetical protein